MSPEGTFRADPGHCGEKSSGAIGTRVANDIDVPQVTLRTGFESDGEEEVLREYLCDWPDCPNIAVHVLGVAKELGLCSVICAEHAAMIDRSRNTAL